MCFGFYCAILQHCVMSCLVIIGHYLFHFCRTPGITLNLSTKCNRKNKLLYIHNVQNLVQQLLPHVATDIVIHLYVYCHLCTWRRRKRHIYFFRYGEKHLQHLNYKISGTWPCISSIFGKIRLPQPLAKKLVWYLTFINMEKSVRSDLHNHGTRCENLT